MADDGFNGTTIHFDSSEQTPLRDISFGSTGAEVDVSGAGDSAKTYESGLPDDTCTFTLVGAGAGIDVGDEAAITITWSDTDTDSMANSVVVGVDKSGSMDSEILTAVTVRPTAA